MEKLVYLLLTLWTAACICQEENTYKRNRVAPRIWFGLSAIENQFPYQAFIYYDDEFHCGASIIHKRWLLTAAHCKKSENVENVYVKVGTIYGNGMDGQRINIEKFIQHEDFDLDKIVNVGSTLLWDWSNDIALIRLSDGVRFKDSVKLIKVAKDDRNKYENVTATVSGLGSTHRVSRPEELQSARVRVISDAECEKSWAKEKIVVLRQTICTSVVNKTTACRGDSGGPLVYQEKQIGIVSFGSSNCSRPIPNVYTRLSSFIPWINRQLNSYSDVLP